MVTAKFTSQQVQNQNQGKCPKGHDLQYGSKKYIYQHKKEQVLSCDGCKKSFSQLNCGTFRCQVCDYDRCEKCYFFEDDKNKKVFCSNRHVMTEIVIRQNDKQFEGFQCDKCSNQVCKQGNIFLRCMECDQDLCEQCLQQHRPIVYKRIMQGIQGFENSNNSQNLSLNNNTNNLQPLQQQQQQNGLNYSFNLNEQTKKNQQQQQSGMLFPFNNGNNNQQQKQQNGMLFSFNKDQQQQQQKQDNRNNNLFQNSNGQNQSQGIFANLNQKQQQQNGLFSNLNKPVQNQQQQNGLFNLQQQCQNNQQQQKGLFANAINNKQNEQKLQQQQLIYNGSFGQNPFNKNKN